MQEENSTENLDALLQQDEIVDALQQQILAGDDSDGAGGCDSEIHSASSSSSESSAENEFQEYISSSNEEVDTLSASNCEDETVSGNQLA